MPHPFLNECTAILARTPGTLQAMLGDLPEVWTSATEGEGTWSPYFVVGHLIRGEQADWIPRVQSLLKYGTSRSFEPFDREAQFRDRTDKSLGALLEEFRSLRQASLARLTELDLGSEHLELEGTHPHFGPVTLRQLLATWTAHDLAHILQISRTMAKRLKQDVGPWAEYLSVMK